MLQNSVSYEYYLNYYSMGQKPILSHDDFLVYEARARAFLKRVCKESSLMDRQDDVSSCICAVADEMYFLKDHHIKSENTDGYSVTYDYSESGAKKLYSILNLYLGHTGALYLGVE